jgi:tRNA (cmo5U34)-methyltransferase
MGNNMSQQLTQPYIDQLKEVFDSFDVDGNGSLSRDEVAQVLRSLQINLSDADIKSILVDIDRDSNNTIEFEELLDWFANQVDLTSEDNLSEIFKLIDLDNDGHLSTDELAELLEKLNVDISNKDIQLFMQQADADKNGLIDFDEFIKAEGLWNRIKLTLSLIHPFYVQAEFDALSQEYNDLIRLWVPWYDENVKMAIDSLPSEPSEPHVLDLGSGTGNISNAILDRYPKAHVHILDNASEMIKFCRHRFGKNNRVHIYEQDFMASDFEAASFDHIVAQFTLHHLEGTRRKKLFQKMYNWLKPEGVFVYSGEFWPISKAIERSFYQQWQSTSYELGATPEQWNHFMDHDQRYDIHTPILVVVDWLREAGFVDIDILWRRLMWAIIVARKV